MLQSELVTMPADLDADVLSLLALDRLRGIEHERLESIRELVVHGEIGIAVENLCENVFELDSPLDSSDLAWLQKLEGVVVSLGLRDYYRRIVGDVIGKAARQRA